MLLRADRQAEQERAMRDNGGHLPSAPSFRICRGCEKKLAVGLSVFWGGLCPDCRGSGILRSDFPACPDPSGYCGNCPACYALDRWLRRANRRCRRCRNGVKSCSERRREAVDPAYAQYLHYAQIAAIGGPDANLQSSLGAVESLSGFAEEEA